MNLDLGGTPCFAENQQNRDFVSSNFFELFARATFFVKKTDFSNFRTRFEVPNRRFSANRHLQGGLKWTPGALVRKKTL